MSALTFVPAPTVEETAAVATMRLPVDRGVSGEETWTDGAGRERRRQRRLRVSQAVKLLDPVSGRYHAGVTRDVSETGYCLELPPGVCARAGGSAFLHVASECRGLGLVAQQSLLPVRFIWVRREGVGGRNPQCVVGVEVEAESGMLRNAA